VLKQKAQNEIEILKSNQTSTINNNKIEAKAICVCLKYEYKRMHMRSINN